MRYLVIYLPQLYFSVGCICVCLGPEASIDDEIRVMCQAVWLRSMLSRPASKESPAQMQSEHYYFLTLTGRLSLIYSELTLFSLKGHWEMVHESHGLMDKVFDPFVKGEHKHKSFHLLIFICCVFPKNFVLGIVSRCESCRVGHETNLTGLGWVEGGMENKNQLNC